MRKKRSIIVTDEEYSLLKLRLKEIRQEELTLEERIDKFIDEVLSKKYSTQESYDSIIYYEDEDEEKIEQLVKLIEDITPFKIIVFKDKKRIITEGTKEQLDLIANLKGVTKVTILPVPTV